MLVPLFFLIFFASCIHVETKPFWGFQNLGMGDANAENMNVNMNDVDMNIAGGSGNGFDGNEFTFSMDTLIQYCKEASGRMDDVLRLCCRLRHMPNIFHRKIPNTNIPEMSQAEISLSPILDTMCPSYDRKRQNSLIWRGK